MSGMRPTCGHVVPVPMLCDGEPEWYTRNRWWKLTNDVLLNCPGCGMGLSLQHPGREHHAIATDGAVSPSVGCNQCGWHEFIKLEGWSP